MVLIGLSGNIHGKIQSSSKLRQVRKGKAEIPDTLLRLTGISTAEGWTCSSNACSCAFLCRHSLRLGNSALSVKGLSTVHKNRSSVNGCWDWLMLIWRVHAVYLVLTQIMIITINDSYHGVGNEVNGIQMTCRFSLRRYKSANREKCVEMLKTSLRKQHDEGSAFLHSKYNNQEIIVSVALYVSSSQDLTTSIRFLIDDNKHKVLYEVRVYSWKPCTQVSPAFVCCSSSCVRLKSSTLTTVHTVWG